jgi:hypothetical protein
MRTIVRGRNRGEGQQIRQPPDTYCLNAAASSSRHPAPTPPLGSLLSKLHHRREVLTLERRTRLMSIELHYDGKVTCEFGEVATVFGSSRTPGVVHDVSPLILEEALQSLRDAFPDSGVSFRIAN